MKQFLLLFITLVIFSCTTETGKSLGNNITGNKDSLPDSTVFEMETTALDVSPVALPFPFIIDTLSVNDTSKHLYAFFYFPSSRDKKLGEIIIRLVKNNTLGYEDYHPGEFDQVSIQAWISSFAVTHQLISMCFTDQSFSTGAAHFNHGYTSLNYDSLKHKEIFLTDIFNLRTEKEKQNFCDSILSPEINTDLRIETTDLKKETDFIIEKGNLIFFFDDFEKGPSMCTYSVSLNNVKSFIRKEYEILLQ